VTAVTSFESRQVHRSSQICTAAAPTPSVQIRAAPANGRNHRRGTNAQHNDDRDWQVPRSIRASKDLINAPQHWRDRAEAARTLADELTAPDSKRRMLRIAQDFEELARRAEQRLARKP
jgi:hypothetical protein